MEVEVVFPYEPQHDDELRLNVGDIITDVCTLETGWYSGTIGNVNGVFPDNFVKVLSKEPKNASTENGIASTPPNVQKREMGGRRCRVVFSYAPQHDDELPLCVGQTITVLQEVEEGWWKGVLDGQVGMFPSNFVEDVGEEDTTSKSTESNLENINNQLNVNGDQKEIKPKPVQGMGYGVKLTDLKKDVNNKKENEVPSSNGSAKILGSSGSSAFQPVHRSKEPPKENGQVKDFRDLPHKLPPALEPKAERVTSKTDKTRINAADKERISSLEKDRISITIGEEKPKTEQAGKRDHSSAVSDGTAPPPQLPPKPVRELARVMFPYAAEHEDELELKEGDVITILCKELEDKGWWRGELNNQIGVFPDNFVELISVEETAKPPRPEKPAAVLAKKGSPSSSADTTPTGTLRKTDKEPPPPLPEKKVQAPPPLEKKPGVAGTASTDTHDGITSSKEKSDVAMNKMIRARSSAKEPNLSLDIEGERLKHVIRPKGPSRRPPSGLFKENMKNPIAADSDTLLATPEDDLEDDTSVQANGHIGGNELPRSPSVPSLVLAAARSPAPVPATSPSPLSPTLKSAPRSEPNKDVPWLQELRLNQRKKVSSIINTDDSMSASGPAVSPKPGTGPQKPEEKPVTKTARTITPVQDNAVSDAKIKASEPHIPNPDYESAAPSPHPGLSKNKPYPRTPLSGINFENRKSIVTDSPASPSIPEVKRSTTTEVKRTTTTSTAPRKFPASSDVDVKESKGGPVLQKDSKDIDNHLEEKVNAIYKDLLPKIKMLEDRIEENKKQQSHRIQMLMTELDEERKKRACMEVEIERLKKLVNSYAQV